SFDAVLAMIANKPLDFKPGSKWAYSNTNYVLLGHIVAIVSGVPWQTYIREHVFAPAGMTESAFMEDEPKLADMATGYTKYKGTLMPTGSFDGWARGAGAIVSTASDLAKWDVALFDGKIVAPADVRLMTSPGPLPSGADAHYGFGWMVDSFDGQPRVWHNGGTMGFLSQNDVYPALQQAVIVLQSFTGANPATVADAAFDALHPTLAAAKLKPVAGEDPAVTARAKKVWQELLAGVVDRAQFDASMNKALTPAMLQQGTAQLKALGPATTWTYAGEVKQGALTAYMYHLAFSSGAQLTLVMSVDANGKIAGFAAH
ncbi:MAG TPA: serine hydrolase, partial [Candidatus Baltobacteraceae bacterium]|nr:serine hydrolase [Candidatus Baltobacteraceae bacterium]